MTNNPQSVEFERPPVVEVVCGVQFITERPLRVVDVGEFHRQVVDQFPEIEEAPVLGIAMEPEDLFGEARLMIEPVSLPPLRRTWMIDSTGHQLLQLQQDWFLFNWKRVSDDQEYPRYSKISAWFEQHWNRFTAFVADRDRGAIVIRQFELSYFNHIGPDNGLAITGHGGVLIDHTIQKHDHRFLPEPRSYAWRSVYELPDRAGRLSLRAQRGRRRTDNVEIMQLELTARGFPHGADPSDVRSEQRRAWFDQAHHWIIFGFKDATSEELHKKAWGIGP
jgi:uncharacterized protein (TIGR04255 family)